MIQCNLINHTIKGNYYYYNEIGRKREHKLGTDTEKTNITLKNGAVFIKTSPILGLESLHKDKVQVETMEYKGHSCF